MVSVSKTLLEQSYQLLGSLSNIEGALYDLLSDEVLVERLPLTPEDQQPALRLKVGRGGRQGREVGGDGGVSWLLRGRGGLSLV